MTVLIGIYGDSRAGKDSVASILVEHLGFEQRNMADPIRETLLALELYVSRDGYYLDSLLKDEVNRLGWDGVKRNYPETVDWMINLGQAMRDISPRIWLDACLAKPYSRLVIPDIRQPNEYDELMRLGGIVWNVRRDGTVPRGMDRLLEDRDFDAVIYNNHTIDELKHFVLKYARWAIDVRESPEAEDDNQD